MKQIPADILRVNLPGRDRNCLDLAYHIFVILTAFLDAVRGGAVTFEHFERMPPPELDTVEKVSAFGRTCAKISRPGGERGSCPARCTPITACSHPKA